MTFLLPLVRSGAKYADCGQGRELAGCKRALDDKYRSLYEELVAADNYTLYRRNAEPLTFDSAEGIQPMQHLQMATASASRFTLTSRQRLYGNKRRVDAAQTVRPR